MYAFATAQPVVVGVDGSAGSLAALRWSAPQARLLRVPLIVVHAWEPAAGRRAPYAPAATCRTPEEERARADDLLHAAVTAVLGPCPPTGLRTVLAEGRTVAVLLRHSRDAALLVLGRRALAGDTFRDLGRRDLGPVGRDCVRAAGCPVVSVPESAAPALAGLPPACSPAELEEYSVRS